MEDRSAAKRYGTLEGHREVYLERAREASEVTIPFLVPPEGNSNVTNYPTPYQSMGSRGVNNLASKLMLALFPPNTPFFRLQVSDYDIDEMTQGTAERAEVEEGLARVERAVQTKIETTSIRPSMFVILKHLIVSGNILIYFPKEGGVRSFRLDRFVVKRDPMGNIMEILVKEDVAPDTIPEEMREEVKKGMRASDKSVSLYTYIYLEGNKWYVFQEAQGIKVPGSEGTYPKDKSPWLPLRWEKIEGEDYGRGFIEQHLGDLISLEGLSKAMVQASAQASRVVWLVNPNGVTDEEDLAGAETGDYLTGNQEDVAALTMDKLGDFRVTYEQSQKLELRLSYAFMLNTSIQRSGERVTAEEIRYMAGELEDALGGVYSILSQELQLPMVRLLMSQMQKSKELPTLPDKIIQPTIVTGLEALGRGHDLNKLQLFINQLQPLGPEIIQRYLNIGDFIDRVGTSLGIDMGGLVRSDEEIQAEMQQQQEAMMVEKGLPNGINAVAQMAQQEQEDGV
jgi:hypothetical protein